MTSWPCDDMTVWPDDRVTSWLVAVDSNFRTKCPLTNIFGICWFILTLITSRSKVKVTDQNSWSQDEQELSSCWDGRPFGHNKVLIDMGRKVGGCCAPFHCGSWVAISHNVAWAEAYLRTKCHLDPSSRFATTNMCRKLGTVPLFRGEGAGFPSNTMWPERRPTFIPSGT